MMRIVRYTLMVIGTISAFTVVFGAIPALALAIYFAMTFDAELFGWGWGFLQFYFACLMAQAFFFERRKP